MSATDVNTRLESQLSRRYCQTFSTGLSSGDFGGSGSRLMLAGTSSFSEVCQAGIALQVVQSLERPFYVLGLDRRAVGEHRARIEMEGVAGGVRVDLPRGRDL